MRFRHSVRCSLFGVLAFCVIIADAGNDTPSRELHSDPAEFARIAACDDLWNQVRALPWDHRFDLGTVLARNLAGEKRLRNWIAAQPIVGDPRRYPDGVTIVDVALSLPHLCLELRALSARGEMEPLPPSGWLGRLTLAKGDHLHSRGVVRGAANHIAKHQNERRASAVAAARGFVASLLVEQMETLKVSATRLLSQVLHDKPELRRTLLARVAPLIRFDPPDDDGRTVTLAGSIATIDVASLLAEIGGVLPDQREFLRLNRVAVIRAEATTSYPPIEAVFESSSAYRWGDTTLSATVRIGGEDNHESDKSRGFFRDRAPSRSKGRYLRFLTGAALIDLSKIAALQKQRANPPKNIPLDPEHLLETAKLAARDSLLLQISTLPTSANATVRDWMTRDDAIARSVALLLSDTRYVSQETCDDGSVEVTAEIPLARLADVLLWFETYQRAMGESAN